MGFSWLELWGVVFLYVFYGSLFLLLYRQLESTLKWYLRSSSFSYSSSIFHLSPFISPEERLRRGRSPITQSVIIHVPVFHLHTLACWRFSMNKVKDLKMVYDLGCSRKQFIYQLQIIYFLLYTIYEYDWLPTIQCFVELQFSSCWFWNF